MKESVSRAFGLANWSWAATKHGRIASVSTSAIANRIFLDIGISHFSEVRRGRATAGDISPPGGAQLLYIIKLMLATGWLVFPFTVLRKHYAKREIQSDAVETKLNIYQLFSNDKAAFPISSRI